MTIAAAPTTLGAIVALFASDATLAADFTASGGLWPGGIPEDKQTLPFVLLPEFSEKPSWTFEGNVKQDEGDWSLIVYAEDAAEAEALAADVLAVFDPSSAPKAGQTPGAFVTLAIAGATSAWIERQDYRVKLVAYRAADSTWVYEVTMPFKSFVTRTV